MCPVTLNASKGTSNHHRASTGLKGRNNLIFFPQVVPLALRSIWYFYIKLLFVPKNSFGSIFTERRHLSAHYLTRSVFCLSVSTCACLRLINSRLGLSFRSCLTPETLTGSSSCAWSSRADNHPLERHAAVGVESFQSKLAVFRLVYTHCRRRGRSRSS